MYIHFNNIFVTRCLWLVCISLTIFAIRMIFQNCLKTSTGNICCLFVWKEESHFMALQLEPYCLNLESGDALPKTEQKHIKPEINKNACRFPSSVKVCSRSQDLNNVRKKPALPSLIIVQDVFYNFGESCHPRSYVLKQELCISHWKYTEFVLAKVIQTYC